MPLDPITGPMPRSEFVEAVNAPFGQARKAIRKYDPLWGREAGEPIKWKVKYSRRIREEGTATVEAATLKEAEKLADKLPEDQISWDVSNSWDDDIEIESVEPTA